MNLTSSKKDLMRIATRMAGIAERKGTMPILSNVLLRAENGRLHFAATDLFQSLVGEVTAAVETAGEVAVSAKDLVERIKMMPDGPVVMTTKDQSFLLKSVGAARRYTLRAIPGGDFPPIPTAGNGATLSVPVDVIATLIALAHFSVSTDESRPHLNSALLEWEGSTVRMVSTDGHRLSKVERVVEGKSASSTMLLPLRGLHEVRRIVEDLHAVQDEEREELRITPSGASAFFAGGGLTFSVKLIDAQFPPYKQVIPAESPKLLRAPRVALADAVRAVSVAADAKTNGVKLALSKGTLRLSSESAISGDGVDEVPVEYVGPNMAIGFHAKYLLDVLGALSSDEVTIGLNGELDPIVVRPLDDAGTDAIFVVMPMRI